MSNRTFAAGLIVVGVAASIAYGQAASEQVATIVGGGYTPPAAVNVSPGQIITVFAQGVASGLTTDIWAPGVPLPRTLAGISVTLRQAFGTSPIAVPLIAIRPVGNCTTALSTGNCAQLVGITVQIPFELVPICLLCLSPVSNNAELTIEEAGRTGKTIVRFEPVPDRIHVVTNCDPSQVFGNEPCHGIVTHADGSPVTLVRPATQGETLVMYAVGLGLTVPSVASGAPSPAPPATTMGPIRVGFDFSANAPPVRPQAPVTPVFAGLSPSAVGLYQVNFVVPEPPSGTPPCSGSVLSNLTVSISGELSFDGAGICVKVP